jgi:hypothetical protein
MINLPRRLLLATSYPRYRSFLRDAADPDAAADRVWRETWGQIRDASFWRAQMDARGPASPPLSAFPLTDYETYREPLERSFHRERCELSGATIRFWAESAGSTGRRKLFPITDHYRKQFQRTVPPYLHRVARRFTGLFREPILYFAGPYPSERSPAGVEVGLISNYNYRNIPAFLRRQYAFPLEALRSEEAYSTWRPLYALATDISAIFGIVPTTMVRFFETMAANFDRFEPVLAGRAQPPAPLPPVQVSRERLLRIKRALSRTPFSLRELWPSLEFIVCWKSSTSGMQLPPLERYLDERVAVVEGIYSATEGWMNVPDATGRAGGALHPGAHVFEFLPEGASADARNLQRASELEEGEVYEIVLTTSMGFVRYRLKDLVRCTGHLARSPILEFVQKAENELSVGPVIMSELDLGRALEQAGINDRSRLVFAPAPEGECIQLCHLGDLDPASAAAVDRALRDLNHLYREGVDEGLMRPITARRLRDGHPAIDRDDHAQTKPRILVRDPIAD